MSPSIETFEHHSLLAQAVIRETDIDKYFRIVFDNTAADWTFVCPQDYRDITDKQKRFLFTVSKPSLCILLNSLERALRSTLR